jgi:hypothetical protein
MSRFYNIRKVLVAAFLSGIEPHRIRKGYCDILLKSQPRQPRTPVKRPFELYNQPLSPERRDEPGGLLWTNVAHCESENRASGYPRDHNDGICQGKFTERFAGQLNIQKCSCSTSWPEIWERRLQGSGVDVTIRGNTPSHK